MDNIAIAAGAALFCLVMQALFGGYETGFVMANPIRIRYLAEEERLKRAAWLLRHMHRPNVMLTMLLLGCNLGTIGGTIAIAQFFKGNEIPYDGLLTVLIVTPVFLIFAEILPKSMFRSHPDRMSLFFMPAIRLFYIVLWPLAWPVATFAEGMLRLMGAKSGNFSPLMSTLEDMRLLVDESADQGSIEREEQRMIHSIIDLQTTSAKEIMRPRIDIVALPVTATRQELLDLLVSSGRTRIPVYETTIDNVIGAIDAYAVLRDANPGDEDITRFIRDVIHVHDTIKVDDLFQILKREKQHLAIITDEYGGTDGLLTIEDILEEIFGEIQDEHDREERSIRKVGKDAYVVEARASVEDLSAAVGVQLEDEAVETVGGWVMQKIGRIPSQGEVLRIEPFRVTILDAGASYIAKLRLELLPDTPESQQEE